MSTASITQQNNASNTLLVSSPVILSSSASHLNSSSTPLTSNAASQFITTQNTMNNPHQPILQVFPNQQRSFQFQQLYPQQAQMFFQNQSQLVSHKTNLSHSNNGNAVLKQTMLSNNQPLSHNNQPTVVFNRLPQIIPTSQPQILVPSKNLLDSQKGKQFMLQNSNPANIQPKPQIISNQITSQAILGSQFKQPINSGQIIAAQSPLINQTQFLSHISQPIAWTTNQQPLMAPNSSIFIRPPNAASEGQLFLHASNTQVQTVSGTPIYVSPNTGTVQLVQANPSTINELNQYNLEPIKNASILPNSAEINVAERNQKNKFFVSNQKKKNAEKLDNHNNKQLINKKVNLSSDKLITKTNKHFIDEMKTSDKFSNKLVKSESVKNLNNFSMKNSKLNKSLDKLDFLLDNEDLKVQKKKEILNGLNDTSKMQCLIKKDKGEKKKVLQKTTNKPKVLTHCIDGYIIHESSVPFAIKNKSDKNSMTKETLKIANNLENIALKESDTPKSKDKKIKKNKKINKVNANIFSLNQLNQSQLSSTETSQQSSSSSEIIQNDLKITQINEKNNLDKDIYEWTIDDVYEFVKQTTSLEFAIVLKKEQIDGIAFTLLTVATLREDFKLKLGPILTLNEKIKELKEKSSPYNDNYLPEGGKDINKWSVKDVYNFINHVSSKEYAEEFERQEMDGQALTLLSQENLINDMNIAFGPTLKILNRINKLKE